MRLTFGCHDIETLFVENRMGLQLPPPFYTNKCQPSLRAKQIKEGSTRQWLIITTHSRDTGARRAIEPATGATHVLPAEYRVTRANPAHGSSGL